MALLIWYYMVVSKPNTMWTDTHNQLVVGAPARWGKRGPVARASCCCAAAVCRRELFSFREVVHILLRKIYRRFDHVVYNAHSPWNFVWKTIVIIIIFTLIWCIYEYIILRSYSSLIIIGFYTIRTQFYI